MAYNASEDRKRIMNDIRKEESKKTPNQDRLMALYWQLRQVNDLIRRLNEKEYLYNNIQLPI